MANAQVTQNFDTVTAPALPSGVTAFYNPSGASGVVTSTLQAKSGTNSLTFNGTPTYIGCAHFGQDTAGGNVTNGTDFYIATVAGGYTEAFIFARFTTANWGTSLGYYLDVQTGSSSGHSVGILRKTTGAPVTVTTLSTTAISTAGWYHAQFTCNGSTLSGRISRYSDGQYLQANGTSWGAAVDCVSGTDTTTTGAGYHGVGQYSNDSTAVFFDNYSESGFTSTFPVDLTHWLALPYSTYSDGTGAISSTSFLHSDCTYLMWLSPGGYCRTAITLPSGTGGTISLALDLTNYTGATYYPYFKVSVDGGIYSYVGGTSASSVQLASGLAAGTHQVEIQLMYNDGGIDRWNTPSAGVKITGLVADTSATLSTPTYTSQTTYTFLLGDSIVEGAQSSAELHQVNSAVINADGHSSWASIVARSLGTEYGNCSCVGTAYTGGNTATHWPALASSWSNYYSGHSRLVSGLLFPAPNYIIVGHGTNDNNVNSALTTQLAALLPAWRTAAPSAEILICVPFDGNNRSVLTSAVASYKASSGDAHVWLIDVGTQPGFGYPLQTPATGVPVNVPNENSPDGVHPNGLTNALEAANVLKIYQAQKSAVAGTTITNTFQPRRSR